MSNQVGVSGSLVEQVGLIVRVDGAYGHPVDAASEQGLDDALLIGDPFAGHLHLGVGGKFGSRGFDSFGGDSPKGTNAIGDERRFGGWPPVVARRYRHRRQKSRQGTKGTFS